LPLLLFELTGLGARQRSNDDGPFLTIEVGVGEVAHQIIEQPLKVSVQNGEIRCVG
jgi:hypothetical protein